MQIKDLIGKPFADGGRGPAGYDCYGLAMEVYRRQGIILPELNISCMDTPQIAAEIDRQRPQWIRLQAPENPCVVAIMMSPGIVNHVGFYIGDGRFIHAYRNAGGVCIGSVNDPIWRRRIEGYYKPGWLT